MRDEEPRPANQPPAGASAEGAGRGAQGGQGVGASADGSGREAEQPSVDSSAQPTTDAQSPLEQGSAQVEQDIDNLLANTQRERDEYLELAQRTKADFENYRKRMAAEVQVSATRGKSEVALELIGAIDNLERALAASESGDADSLVEGVRMVLDGLRDTLSRHGIEVVDPNGEKFDPQWHEALSTAPTEGTDAGTVVEVMQKGYRLGEQLIRPARVVVSE